MRVQDEISSQTGNPLRLHFTGFRWFFLFLPSVGFSATAEKITAVQPVASGESLSYK